MNPHGGRLAAGSASAAVLLTVASLGFAVALTANDLGWSAAAGFAVEIPALLPFAVSVPS